MPRAPQPSISPSAWLAALAIFVWSGSCPAEVLLMKNGAVLAGEVRVDGDRVLLRSEHSELLLRRSEVAATVATLAEAYRWQRERLDPNAASAEDRCRLAEWCIRQSLWREASEELAAARRLAPGWQRLALLERRLSMQREPVATPPGGVALASHNEPSAVEPDAGLTLPDAGLEYFTRRVQPLLVNNCTNGGCHLQERGGAFALDRRLLYGYADARSTQHNLRAALLAIDPTDPGASPLLRAASGAHHGVTPITGPRRAELLGRLTAWVNAVAASNAPVAPAAAAGVATAVYEAPIDETQSKVERAVAHDGSLSVDMLRPANVVRGGLLVPAKPRDEFDPAVFNDKFRRPMDDEPVDPAP
ncbi:MAG: hypothetical protein ACRCT8_10500 [Lacipirellulaceae bacterium]